MIRQVLLSVALSTYILSQEPIEVNVVDVGLNADEIDILAQLTMAEAEGESELGQRLVIDTVLNRIKSDIFPNDLRGVVYQEGQFSCIKNGRYDRCYPTDDIRELVKDEICSRTNDEVLYFNAKGYKYGTPICKEDHHYFSGE